MVERDQLIEIGVAVATVIVMLGTMISIGSTYGGDSGTLSADGGQLLVMAITGFIFLMLVVGITLAYVLNDPEDGLESDETDADAGSAI
ncbi:DUF7472 family protein [Haloterrigena alkaliphila]|uniref:Uncharacterized protein n=1 Tax=Haloterrigena alkaliphila TaxID=2816475 RepID=A0A8A2VGV9_9EURY|nr:hypothetical protein [Haloterrigena alkaliphila]QSX00752.1 hypothetical protein J0X25_07285 [Haloterrigena alkaliphila]